MIPRVHSLIELLALISTNDASFLLVQGDANVLEGYAVQFRYPGMSADKSEAKQTIAAAERMCLFIRIKSRK